MYSQIFLRRNILNNYSINQTLRRQFVSQTISSPKPTLTRILRQRCDIRFFGQSKIHTFSLRSSVCKHNGQISISRNSSDIAYVKRTKSPLDINTNVINNVLLYKYEKTKHFSFLKVFAFLQIIIMGSLAYYFYTLLRKRDENEPLLRYVYDNRILLILVSLPILTGIMALAFLMFYTSRSIKYIVLNKGGETATFVTFRLLSRKAATTIPTDYISCKFNRQKMPRYLPISIKGRRFYYILNTDGEFVNPKLFDSTIGLMRLY